MVSTLDFESSDPSSNLGGTWLTPWRNGSASDSRSEGCVFESRRGQNIFGVFRMFFVHSWKKIDCASNEDWTHDLWFTRPTLCHWAIEADVICSEQKIVRGHTDLNHGPIGLQPIALPLSYIPTSSESPVWLYMFAVHVREIKWERNEKAKWESKWESNIGVARDL